MGFEIFLQACRNGRVDGGIAAETLRSLLAGDVRQVSPTCWRLEYAPNDYCHIYYSDEKVDPASINSFMIQKPTSNPKLWDGLFAIMRLGNMVLYYPGCGGPIIADEAMAEHLPSVMNEELGQPYTASSGQEIFERVRAG